MVMSGYSTFPQTPGLDPHYKIVLCHIRVLIILSKTKSFIYTQLNSWYLLYINIYNSNNAKSYL